MLDATNKIDGIPHASSYFNYRRNDNVFGWPSSGDAKYLLITRLQHRLFHPLSICDIRFV